MSSSLGSVQLRLNEFEIDHALRAVIYTIFKVMDPLACFFVVVLGGEVWETAKLLRGSFWASRGPIRLFGFLSL